MTLKSDEKFKGQLSRGLKNDIKNLVNFHVTSWKSENLQFDGLLLSKAYKVLDEKVQKSYVSWHWRVMQSLKKNWLLVPKMAWGIYWILMRAVASLKIFTLIYRGAVLWKMTYGFKNDISHLVNFHARSWK